MDITLLTSAPLQGSRNRHTNPAHYQVTGATFEKRVLATFSREGNCVVESYLENMFNGKQFNQQLAVILVASLENNGAKRERRVKVR